MSAALECIRTGLLVIAIALGFAWCIDCWVFFDGMPGMFW